MKNKKGQTSTDTPIIISIFTFQIFIIIMLGFLDINTDTKDVGLNADIPLIGHIGFAYNIITNISILGWGNLLLFTPSIIALAYIIAKLIRGGG